MSRSLLGASLLLATLWSAGQAMALEVVEVVLTTAIVEREPVDKVEVMPSQVGKLYCFTRITGADEATLVYHLWYRGEELLSRVALPVRSSDWRTWSQKSLQADPPGEWRVEIRDADGKFLQQAVFELR